MAALLDFQLRSVVGFHYSFSLTVMEPESRTEVKSNTRHETVVILWVLLNFFPISGLNACTYLRLNSLDQKKKNLFEVIITTIHTISAFSLFIYLFILHHKPDKAYFSNRLHKNYFNLVIKDKLIIFPFSHAVFGRTCSEVPLSWFSYYKNLRSYVTNTTLICPLKSTSKWT